MQTCSYRPSRSATIQIDSFSVLQKGWINGNERDTISNLTTLKPECQHGLTVLTQCSALEINVFRVYQLLYVRH